MLSAMKHLLTDWRFRRNLGKYNSRMSADMAAPFTAFHARCRAAYAPRAIANDITTAASQFAEDGFASYWSPRLQPLAEAMLAKVKEMEASGDPWDADYVFKGDAWLEFPELEEAFKAGLADFIESIYGSHLKVFYAKLYKAVRTTDRPTGSQLWHSDGGPGTCINLMLYLSEGTRENGAMEVVSWKDTREIFTEERPAMRRIMAQHKGEKLSRLQARELLTAWYAGQIATRGVTIQQPTGAPGLALAFRNNTIHKGGFPNPDHVRYVIVLHVYPSLLPLDYASYRRNGAAKTGSQPADPAF